MKFLKCWVRLGLICSSYLRVQSKKILGLLLSVCWKEDTCVDNSKKLIFRQTDQPPTENVKLSSKLEVLMSDIVSLIAVRLNQDDYVKFF